jgi:hypothetical protein
MGLPIPTHHAPHRQHRRPRSPAGDRVLEDLDAAVQRARDAGATQQGTRVDWKGSRCITFADPFGNGFCLIAFDGESYGG